MKRVHASLAALGMLLGLAWVIAPATPAGAAVTGVVQANGTMTGGTSVGTTTAAMSSSFVGTWNGPVSGTTLACQLNGDLSGNQSITSGTVGMTWSCTNGPIEIYCWANGNRLGNEIGARGRCSGDAGFGDNEVTLNWTPTTGVPVTRYHLTGSINIVWDNPTATGPSSLCDNEIQSGTGLVTTHLAYEVIDDQTIAVCYRIGSGETVEGGRVIITLPTPDPGSINPPFVDDNADACTTVLQDGRLLGNDELSYYVAYSLTDPVSVCVKLGNVVAKRIVISTDVIEPPSGLIPGVDLERDPA
jgi:hypothetical protein